MAKKHFGKVFAFAAVAGAAMGAVTYFLRYKSFHKELDEEFHDFEDEFDEFDEDKCTGSTAARTYVPLNSDKAQEKDDAVSGTAAAESAQTEAASETCDDCEKAPAEDILTEEVKLSSGLSSDSTTIVEDTAE